MNIIDFFDKRRYWGTKRNFFLNKICFYGITNYFITRIANTIIPIYFKLTRNNPNYELKTRERKPLIIVSLTSFPPRIPTLWRTIESIMRQTVKPDKIILYLTESQIGKIESLPQSLLRLRKRGLEIKLCKEEIRSHTKYFEAFKEYPDDIVVTVDDDLYYRSDLIDNLLKCHNKYPNAIIANWIKEISPNTPNYKEWTDGKVSGLSHHYFLLGVGSILYPPKCMYKDIFNVDLIKSLCLTADDVWLSCMALMANTPIFYTAYKYNYLPILIKNNTTLISVNKERNQICVDNLNNYYFKAKGIKPFIDLVK